MSGFNFGNTASTSAGATGSLFGSAGAQNDGKSLFGSNTGNTGSSGWTFGQTPTPAASTGNQSNSSNIFGGGATGTSSGNIFGSKTDDKSADTSKPAFGGFTGFGGGSSQTPGTPAQPPATTNLFGSTTPAPSNNIFGQPNSTTPAGQPPTNNFLSASTGGASQPQSGTTPTFSFGKPAPTASAQQPTNQTSTSQGGGSLFSNLNQPTGGSIFSNPTQPADTSSKSGEFKGFGFQKPAESGQQISAAGFSFTQPKKDDKPAQSTAPAPAAFSFPSGTSSTPAPAQTQTSQPAAAPASIFNQQTTSSQPKPSLFSSTPTTSSSSNIFAKPSAPASATAEAPKTGGFTFPGLASATPASTAAQTSTTPAPTKPLFPSLGGNTPSASASSASTPAATTAATSNLFNLGAATTSSATPATAAPAPLFGLGGSTTSAATTTAAAPKPLFSLGGAGASTSGPAPNTTTATTTTSAATSGFATSTLNASTAGPTAPVQSRLRNKTMDEILTRWASDLTRYTKEFKSHAETIAHWDQIIVDNSARIDKLYVKTRTCEKQTMSVEMQLSAVENQQNELEAWLNKYENDIDEMLAKDSSQTEPGGPDQERERTYQLAERLGERLDDMGRDLQSMVEEVNAANASLGKNGKADEPITQIVKILNSHLNQLQAIDQGTTALQAKVAAAQKAANGMSYLNGSLNGDSQAAVDGFYRSFMGRR